MPSTFADLGVPPHLRAGLAERGIVEPFPIQAATLPDALAGRDICGRAPTGSGKTLAFGLAIATLDPIATPRRPRALVLVPTRELAAQVAGELQLLMPTTGHGKKRRDHVVAVYGGASYGPQRRALAQGAAAVVACPGRLEDLLEQGDVDLRDVDIVVIDEADRMADMGFLPAVRRILDRTNEKRQTLLFSATLDGEIDELVRRYQTNPARHEVVPEDDGGDVEHLFWRTEAADRVGLAAALVRRHGPTVVFSRTRHGADRIARQLGQSGVQAVAIHGNRSQAQRERALAAFVEGRAAALVATDVAARGIHVDDVACVVHFDLPADPKDYVHRSGRTGRAGASGTVVAFVPPVHQKAARALQRAVGLPEGLGSPDFAPHEIPARVVQHRSEASGSNGSARSNGGGGGDSRSRQGSGGGHRPNGSRPRAGGHNGGKPGGSGKKGSWRKRSNAAKARAKAR
ncbi:MAG TPA: DEAD/DEAH box helicase [Acidimicrobiales bacterium]